MRTSCARCPPCGTMSARAEGGLGASAEFGRSGPVFEVNPVPALSAGPLIMIPQAIKSMLTAVALGGLCLSMNRGDQGAASRRGPASRSTRSAPVPRDRYGAPVPRTLSLERFHGVFNGLDLDGNRVLTIRESMAAGWTQEVFQMRDLDRNGAVSSEEFEWVYGLEVRTRGESLDAPLADWLQTLDVRARERRWVNKSATSPATGIGSTSKPSSRPATAPVPGTVALPKDRYSGAVSRPAGKR